MFTTIEEVEYRTGIVPTLSTLAHAQAIIEMVSGRPEARVDHADDLHWLSVATTYQAAYMVENAETVFKQIDVSRLEQNDYIVTFRGADSPYIAPLARMALNNLSWTRSRSITVAPAKTSRYVTGWEYI